MSAAVSSRRFARSLRIKSKVVFSHASLKTTTSFLRRGVNEDSHSAYIELRGCSDCAVYGYKSTDLQSFNKALRSTKRRIRLVQIRRAFVNSIATEQEACDFLEAVGSTLSSVEYYCSEPSALDADHVRPVMTPLQQLTHLLSAGTQLQKLACIWIRFGGCAVDF